VEIEPFLGLQNAMLAFGNIEPQPDFSLGGTYVGVPVKLAEPLGFESDKGCSDGLAGRKVGRVYLVELSASARHRLAGVLKGTIDEGRIARELARRIVGYVPGADCAVEDVWVWRGDVLENRLIEAKVFGQNVSRCASNPVVNVEGCAGLECQWFWSVTGWQRWIRTRPCRSRHRQTPKGTRSHPRALGLCELRPWGSTKYLHS